MHKTATLAGSAVVGGAALLAALAPAALADTCTGASGNNVCTSVTVPTTLTLSGLSPNSLNFGNLAAGGTSPADSPVSYTVKGNANYSVQVTGSDLASTSGSLPASTMTVTSTAPASAATNGPQALQAGAPVTTAQGTATNGDTFSDGWKITLPASAGGGTYSGTQQYAVVGR